MKRFLPTLCLLLLAALLGACAGTPGQPGSGATPAEPVTEFDEPENRKRARIRIELASGYFEQGQTTVALDEIKQALAADPNYPAAYNLRGLVYMQMNEQALAEASFNRAVQLNPRDADAMHNLGWMWCQQGRLAPSLDQFARALAVPGYTNAARTWMAQGVCQVRAGQNAEAEKSLTRAFELDASNPITMFNLARLQLQRGEALRAQFYVRRLNASPDLVNAESLWLGLRVERRLGNQDGVRQLADQLRQRFPNSPEWAKYLRGAFDE
ncbi:MAG: type IV pilus biogenesis/stability protein PilW [Hydrogenophaga sp.]|nr:type IV pilus biogenesis/stability protein PilW [Hydrogenophaga sp.]